MTIEKEAREILKVFGLNRGWSHLRLDEDLQIDKDLLIAWITKALQKKQDRIEELEKELAEYKANNNAFKWNELLAKRMNQIGELEERVREYKWEWAAACERERASNERVKELESALKGIIEVPDMVDLDSDLAGQVDEMYKRAKKAIGGSDAIL